ncbi:hypothetical protein EVAR_32301_1 [Eumeta japonica]|uniref:Uncharacterized protein n=1 Tax=Eumeta variegata TaxID=151549 RepID=A0A4C1WFR1_EUMVA|nr:hypothetical protein EVAR_32301_1 [Eumeta japonica]
MTWRHEVSLTQVLAERRGVEDNTIGFQLPIYRPLIKPSMPKQDRFIHWTFTAGHSLSLSYPLNFHNARSWAPANKPALDPLKSSLHLVGGRPMPRPQRRGLQSRTCLPRRSSVLGAMWPVHCHIKLLII